MSNTAHVYFGVRSPVDVYGLEWLEELRGRLPELTVHVVVATSSENGPYRTGLLTDAINEDFDSLKGWRAYIAGAPAMVDAASTLLDQKGVDSRHIYADAFYASSI